MLMELRDQPHDQALWIHKHLRDNDLRWEKAARSSKRQCQADHL